MKLENPIGMKEHKIWKDKRVPSECKYVFVYIHTKAIDLYSVSINVGEFQQFIKINNKGLKKALILLEKLKYIIFEEFDNNWYNVKII